MSFGKLGAMGRGMGHLGALGGAGGGGGLPIPTQLLAGSRFNVLGTNGYTGSDGVDTDSNFRLSTWNETGAGITKLRTYNANWFANATSEQDAYNTITITQSIEYPAGTFTPVTWSGSPSTSITNGTTKESDEIAVAIPANAQYWVRTYISVTAGLKWPQGYLINTSGGLAEAADFSTGVDKTQGGTITNAGASTTRRGYGPVAVKATGFNGTPRKIAIAGLGDSIMAGATDTNASEAAARGNIGALGKAAAGRFPYINLGISGTTVNGNLAANMTRRLALLAQIGVTHAVTDFGINDLGASRSVAQIEADWLSQWTMLSNAGLYVVQSTLTPKSSSSDGWQTTGNQTVFATPAGAFTGGAGVARRSILNDYVRTKPSPLWAYMEWADQVESTRDSGIWGATSAFSATHLLASGAGANATSDGLHPVTTSTTAPGKGGVYILKDYIGGVLDSWALL